MDLSDGAWSVVGLIATGLLGVWMEVIRRGSNRRTDEIMVQTKPIANGFANEVRNLLSDVVKDLQVVQKDIHETKEDIAQVKGSQVDLHRRLDSHLESHPPKLRRKFFG